MNTTDAPLMTLDSANASKFARQVLAGIQREFPHKLDHVLNDGADARSPRSLHPAFYGCFDWHSAVHGHWLLVRLLRLAPSLPEAAAVRQVLDDHLRPDVVAIECAYLDRPNSGSFERTYGWAWLLKLAEELGRYREASAWRRALRPLADCFVDRYLAYLPRIDYPTRTGVHPNTAFGLAFAHDFAIATGHERLASLVASTALRLFERDVDAPAHLEPGGADFFSPSLMQADLMQRVLPAAAFPAWLDRFLPRLADGHPASLFTPARVSDRADLQIVHLDGLNLSRSWCMRSIAASLPPTHPARQPLLLAAHHHLDSALPHIDSGHYGGEHWLATFALLALTGA